MSAISLISTILHQLCASNIRARYVGKLVRIAEIGHRSKYAPMRVLHALACHSLHLNSLCSWGQQDRCSKNCDFAATFDPLVPVMTLGFFSSSYELN